MAPIASKLMNVSHDNSIIGDLNKCELITPGSNLNARGLTVPESEGVSSIQQANDTETNNRARHPVPSKPLVASTSKSVQNDPDSLVETTSKTSKLSQAADKNKDAGYLSNHQSNLSGEKINAGDVIKKNQSESATSEVIALSEHSKLRISPVGSSSDSVDSGRFSHESRQENKSGASRSIDLDLEKNTIASTEGPETTRVFSIVSLISRPTGVSTNVNGYSEDPVLLLQHNTHGSDCTENNKENADTSGSSVGDSPAAQRPESGLYRQGKKRQRNCSSGDRGEPALSKSFLKSQNSKREDEEESDTKCSHDEACVEEEENRPKRKLKRTQYSKSDLRILNAYFHENNWLSPIKQEALAKEMGYTDVQIKTWFQNKRASIYGTRRPKGRNKEQTPSVAHNQEQFYHQYHAISPTSKPSNTQAVVEPVHDILLQGTNGSAFSGHVVPVNLSKSLPFHPLPPTGTNFEDNKIARNLTHAFGDYSHTNNQVSHQSHISFRGSPTLASSSHPTSFHGLSASSTSPVPKPPRQVLIPPPSKTTVPSSSVDTHAADSILSHSERTTKQLVQKPRALYGVPPHNNGSSSLHLRHHRPVPAVASGGMVTHAADSQQRRSLSNQSIDYSRPENNPFIATFLNLTGSRWNSPRCSPLVKPHLHPQRFQLLKPPGYPSVRALAAGTSPR